MRRTSPCYATTKKPAIEISVDLKAQKLQDDIYEMTLHIAARAIADANTLFLVDLAYAGIFQITNIPENRLEQLILIECPFVLFPFARRVIADVTARSSGFPPLMLDPIDFPRALPAEPRAGAGGGGSIKNPANRDSDCAGSLILYSLV